MDTRKHVWASALVTLAVLAGAGCENGGGSAPSGTLRFLANGEDFARLGFTSKDGWQITFDHAYVCVSGPTAFQVVEESAKHAGHSHVGIAAGLAHETLASEYVVDLAKGTEAAELGTISGVAIGNYNRMDWNMVKASGDAILVSQGTDSDLEHALGHCVVLMGTAQKGATTITFTLKFGEEMFYMSTEANVDSGTGKSVGIVTDGGTGVAEMTFHFDHIFGDESTLGEPDSVNPMALGFQPFADLDTDADDVVTATFEQMEFFMQPADVLTLYRAYLTLGHTGEAHCMFMPHAMIGAVEEQPADPTVYTGTGTLEFAANGEEFGRGSFTSKDGWDIAFTKLIVNTSNAKATAVTTEGNTEVALTDESYVVDINKGTDVTVYSTRIDVPAGDYNHVSWEHHRIVAATDAAVAPVLAGDLALYEGYSFIVEGNADNGSEVIDFSIKLNDELGYSAAGPHPDGIGALNDGETGVAEATFHFDHIFGDFDTLGEPDSVNPGALGFQPLADLAVGGSVSLEIDVDDPAATLPAGLSAADLMTFYKAFLTLGHCGEEHCFVALH